MDAKIYEIFPLDIQLDKDQSTASLEIKEHMMNQYGIVHGGVITLFADTLMGEHAKQFYDDHTAVVTGQMNTYFINPAQSSSLYAEAHFIKKGRSNIVIECSVFADEKKVTHFNAIFHPVSKLN